MSDRRSTRLSSSELESNVKYPAAKVPVKKDILADAADWQLQFYMTAPLYNQTKERHFLVEILGGDPASRPDGVIWSRSREPIGRMDVQRARAGQDGAK